MDDRWSYKGFSFIQSCTVTRNRFTKSFIHKICQIENSLFSKRLLLETEVFFPNKLGLASVICCFWLSCFQNLQHVSLPESNKRKSLHVVQKCRKHSYFHILQNHILKKEKKTSAVDGATRKEKEVEFTLWTLQSSGSQKNIYVIVRPVLTGQQKEKKKKCFGKISFQIFFCWKKKVSFLFGGSRTKQKLSQCEEKFLKLLSKRPGLNSLGHKNQSKNCPSSQKMPIWAGKI